jgi:hypothetical protein
MQTVITFIRCISLAAMCFGCVSEVKKVTELSNSELYLKDSISKLAQRRVGDSLKKINPLLILPPDSTFSGEYVDKYTNGITKYTGQFRFGKRHGQWMSFYATGYKWSEQNYYKGIRQGLNETHYENGKIRYSGWYKNDLRDSLWVFNDSTGKTIEKILYKNDKIISNNN